MRLPKWKAIIALFVVLSLVSMTTALAADSVSQDQSAQVVEMQKEAPGGGAVMLDALLMRPLGFGAMLLGCVTWVVAAPFALMADGTDGIGKISKPLVVAPAKFTFKRGLGDF